MLYDHPYPSLQQRVMEDNPDRPLSAIDIGYSDTQQLLIDTSSSPADMTQDSSMEDAGPSTAPLPVEGGNATFFHDD